MTLIDTDICIEILRGNKSVLNKRKKEDDILAVAFMTAAELYYGVQKSTNPVQNSLLIDEFLLTMNIIHTDIPILKTYGELKVQLEGRGFPLADADLLIAATALIKCEKLITGNIKHYNRIEELKIKNWIW